MKFEIKLSGDAEFRKQMDELKIAGGNAMHDAVGQACGIVEAYAKQNHPWQNRSHRLQASITFQLLRGVLYEWIGRVGTNVEYGPHLEFGTRKMKKYPFMYPALAMNAERIQALIAKTLNEELGKVAR